MSDITLLCVPAFSHLANAAFDLRRQVFVWEQNVPSYEENDAYDLTALHYVAIVDGNVVGTLRVIDQPEHAKIGRVAVHAFWRGKGIAKALMVKAMDEARARGNGRFYLSAQTDKIGLYQKLGFTAYGSEYLDAGIPHYDMKTY